MKEICELLIVKKIETAANGLAEKFNRTVVDMISQYCEKKQRDEHICYQQIQKMNLHRSVLFTY